MSFESILKNSLLSDVGLGKSRYVQNYMHNFKDRQHISRFRADLYGSAKYLSVGDSATLRYTDETSIRYIAAVGMTYDLMLSLYDINSRSLFVARFASFDDKTRQSAEKFLGSTKNPKPKWEARIIGMQNSEEYKDLYKIADFLTTNGISVYEIDLFGNEMRHVAIDSKLGVSYNMLMEDRLYRAGELINKSTVEQFEKEVRAQAPASKA
ncbi:MAG: hypothetical protein KGH60_00950 [Candidatus Micrarchaeota archaeon]|nr:hypothetical protein [Candidatus Micrarchaeota archaeon]